MKRRHFLKAGAGATGGLWLAATMFPEVGESTIASPPSGGRFSAYLEITPSGEIFITCPQAEMGQGIHDGLPKILAEDLEARWGDVTVRLAGGDDAYINPLTRRHRTASSESIMIYYALLREAGATARDMLRIAAASRWGVPLEHCIARASRIEHAPSHRSLSFGELADEAARVPLPLAAAPVLKDVAQFTLIGTATPRKDTPAKVDGSAVFGIDVQLPGMVHAALRRSPAVSARVLAFDRDAALALPGVIDAFVIPDGVAIVATSTWLAQRAAQTIDVSFDDTASAEVDTLGMRARMRAALTEDARAIVGRPGRGQPSYDKEATQRALAKADRTFEWDYEVPFVAHAALEPPCATVVVRANDVEAWVPTQQQDRVRDVMSQVTGIPRARCTLHATLVGGSFGRKWEVDYVRQAVQIAREVAKRRPGTPVKLTWTREQDFRHDRFRPAHLVRTRVGVDAQGRIHAMHSRTTGVSLWRYQNRPPIPGAADLFVVSGLISDTYRIAHKYVDYVETPEPIPVGTWRAVSHSMNGFFAESAIDDVAVATRRDPLELRLELCAEDPRAVAVLRKVAELTDWRRRLPKGHGRGLSLALAYNAYCAEVVEVVVKESRVEISRIVAVFDCGLVIDPRNVEAQVEGGIIWGLSAAIDGEIRFAKGGAVEDNFHTAPILRLPQTPRIEVHLLRTAHPCGGAGEASVPGVAPALASAIQMASGTRPRRLPLISAGFSFA